MVILPPAAALAILGAQSGVLTIVAATLLFLLFLFGVVHFSIAPSCFPQQMLQRTPHCFKLAHLPRFDVIFSFLLGLDHLNRGLRLGHRSVTIELES